MGNDRRFAAINTKIRVLKSRLLDDKDYINLIEKANLSEQISYLKENTQYHSVLGNIEEHMDLQHIEISLKRFIIIQFNKIIKYFTDDYGSFYKALILRYEIEDLKTYIRAVGRHEKMDKRTELIKDGYFSIDPNKLIFSSNLDEFTQKLKGTIYYDVLRPYINETDDKIIFYMEMNLDRLYFRTVEAQSQKLSLEDRKIFKDTLEENIELLNIEWIYRGIKFYSLLPEELINYALPYGDELKYSQIKDICYSGEQRLKEVVLKTKYAFLFEGDQDIDLFMDIKIKRYLYYKYQKIFNKGKLDLGISIAYIHLLEYEIRDVISILESISYDLSKHDTVQYLVRKIEGSDI